MQTASLSKGYQMTRWLLTAVMLSTLPLWAQTPQRQTQEDDYTRYELLAPDSSRFRIYYEVTATTPGARFYYNTIRRGSVASDERVVDLATGEPLDWEIVSGKDARAGGHPEADLETEYLKVHLARPVPAAGGARLLIDKTYLDAKSYFREGDTLVFDRSLGIRRNTIVLPQGYRIVSVNVPSQIIPATDGRLQVSFMHAGPGAAPLVVRARPGLSPFTPRLPGDRGAQMTTALPSQAARVNERAHQDREIVYLLHDPATHSFSLFHDYTESRPGVGHYFNVVRAGSRVSDPAAKSLDSGETLKVELLTGSDLARRALDPGETIPPDGQVVVVSFPPVQPNRSMRLRISETYTDAGRYFLDGEELVWDRAFGRPRNTVVLPAGWTTVASAIPAQISEDADGRQRLYFENPRPDEMQVLIRARRLASAPR